MHINPIDTLKLLKFVFSKMLFKIFFILIAAKANHINQISIFLNILRILERATNPLKYFWSKWYENSHFRLRHISTQTFKLNLSVIVSL
jgi:hypothetical protein